MARSTHRKAGSLWTRWVPRRFRNERVGLSLATAAILVAPMLLAAIEASKVVNGADPSRVIVIGGVWVLGLAVGAGYITYKALRRQLIVRDPKQILTNQARNRGVGVVALPLALAGALLLGAVQFNGVDPRAVLASALCGFLLPLMAVVLYITYRLRPDELFSSDSEIAAAAGRRLQGHE